MRIVAVVLCLALGALWVPFAHAEVARPDFDGLERGPDAAETYRLNAIEIVHERTSGLFPNVIVGRGSWWRPVRGKFRWPTTYDDFYLKMGRDDLGARDRHRRVAAETMIWGGLLVSLGGIGVMLSGFANHRTTRAEVGIGMFAGGLVMSTVGANIQPPLVSDEDAEAMANEYNRRLQVHLGLAPAAANTGRDAVPLGFALSRRW
jgi:hypothetical protein